jgi:hypothetical protein
MGQQPQGLAVGVPLPDDIGRTHCHIHWLAPVDFAGDVQQHPVAHLYRVVQTHECTAQTVRAGKVFEDAFPGQAGVGVLPDWLQAVTFSAASQRHRCQRVDIACGEGDDTRLCVAFADQPRQKAVQGPGHGLIAGCAEFLARHKDDIAAVGQCLQPGPVEEIAGNRMHTRFLQLFPQTGTAEAGHAVDPVGQAQFCNGAHGHTRQARPHFAAHTQNHQVAVQLGQSRHCRRRGTGKHLFQLGYTFDAFRQPFLSDSGQRNRGHFYSPHFWYDRVGSAPKRAKSILPQSAGKCNPPVL